MNAQRIHLDLHLDDSPRPGYIRLADALRDAITRLQMEAGTRLPSARVLARQLGMHRHTVMNAYEDLVARGLVQAFPRSGYRVRFARAPSVPGLTRGKRVAAAGRRPPGTAGGWPPCAGGGESLPYRFDDSGDGADALAAAEWRDLIGRAGRRVTPELLDAGAAAGVPALLQSIATDLRGTCGIDGHRVIVTAGLADSVRLVALLLGPGCRVALDRLCRPSIRAQFELAGSGIVPLPMDAGGTDPDALEAILRRQRIDLLCLRPSHQYPTTVTLSAARRDTLYRIAARNGIPILEDGMGHALRGPQGPPVALAARDPAGLVFFLSALPEGVPPAVRVGLLAVPAPCFDGIAAIRACTGGPGNALLQQALADWMRAGGLERHRVCARRLFRERMRSMIGYLSDWRARAFPEIRAEDPGGGTSIWLDTARDASLVAARARAVGVAVVSERDCLAVPAERPGRHLSLDCTRMDAEGMAEGLRRLMRILRDLPPHTAA